MGVFISIVFGAAIAFYVYRIVMKGTKNIKAGQCMSCDGKCGISDCSVNLELKK